MKHNRERPAARELESPTGACITLGGRPVLNFSGSPYLGLAGAPELIDAGMEALRRYGARAYIGAEYGMVTRAQVEVEEEAAEFFGTASAVYLVSGYLAGLTAMTGLRERFDVVVLDERAHYSLEDAAHASVAEVRTFSHLDCDSLETTLSRAHREGLRSLLAIDGMCPTFGSIPPLGIYQELAQAHGATIFVDESHSFGALGATGRGVVEECGLDGTQILRGGSLGKAFCAGGAVMIGNGGDVAQMRRAPCTLGSSWGMVSAAAMAAASIRLVRSRPDILRRLRSNVRRLKAGLRRLGIQVEETIAPLATFHLGTEQHMRELQRRLLAEDIFVLHTRYVGAGPGGAIRLSIFADHTDEQIDRLIDALRRLI